MSPQSLLHTPVELLRTAPAAAEQASHGERAERRVTLRVVLVLLALGLLVAAVLSK